MGLLKNRIRPLSIRQVSRTIKYANKECHEKIKELNNSQAICSCPECKINEHVKCTGTNHGKRKFVCNNHEKNIWFSTSTSYDAIEIYRNAMTANLYQLLRGNAIIKTTGEINDSSKYFIEFPLERLYEYISQEANSPIIKVDDRTDIVTIFFDLSGSNLARNKAIIMAKIENRAIFEIITTSNTLSTHKLLSAIKEKLRISENTKIVFVTDGEKCFVDSIKHFFPDAIHIRQFHKQSCKGIIYVHLKYEDEEYTVKCLWDAVLNEGEASEKIMKQRDQRAKKKLDSHEHKKTVKYTELSKDIIIWKGTVYSPRGIRRKIPKEKKKKDTSIQKKRNTSPIDTAKEIFRGLLNQAKQISVFNYCFDLLKRIFKGLHITSNIIENVFNVKSKLKLRRTMKFGERILVCTLYANIILKNLNKEEFLSFLKKEVVTYNFIRQKVLCGSGLQKNKPKEPSFLEIIKEALDKKKKLIIHYCDKFKKHTSRIITPLEIKLDEYNNTTQIIAYCHLRKNQRTFYLERIRDAAIYDLKPIICI